MSSSSDDEGCHGCDSYEDDDLHSCIICGHECEYCQECFHKEIKGMLPKIINPNKESVYLVFENKNSRSPFTFWVYKMTESTIWHFPFQKLPYKFDSVILLYATINQNTDKSTRTTNIDRPALFRMLENQTSMTKLDFELVQSAFPYIDCMTGKFYNCELGNLFHLFPNSSHDGLKWADVTFDWQLFESYRQLMYHIYFYERDSPDEWDSYELNHPLKPKEYDGVQVVNQLYSSIVMASYHVGLADDIISIVVKYLNLIDIGAADKKISKLNTEIQQHEAEITRLKTEIQSKQKKISALSDLNEACVLNHQQELTSDWDKQYKLQWKKMLRKLSK